MATASNTAYIAFGTAAAETSLQGYANTADLKRVVKELEATTFGDSDEKFNPGIKSAEISIGGDWSQALDNILAPLLGVDAKSAVFGPVGNTTGMVKYSAAAFLKDYQVKSDVLGKATFTGAIRLSGAVTRGVF
jgi:hypothetical protein